ncbi:DUF3034 family protein [Alkalimonas collagenimarina]|uniref:DUF3034 family protein n=1 Tax=Alkalimonas collagenimarina TaxID=400390 RepID=A0ABT9GZ12_9GAMM|nr:DUF3034 family protein [Alkalimonas collagenimarina]MDP4536109.1 DUF3034 family protein [Alkalimonas collagenimarina]
MKFLLLLLLFSSSAVLANSRVIGTGGVTSIEGSAGGGIVPWAVINGYHSTDEWSANSFISRVSVDDFTLNSAGVGVGLNNRWELSYARQQFKLDTIGGQLRQDIVGVKYRLTGELLYTAMPQISIGAQYKRHLDFDLPAAVGARSRDGVDLYLAASKVWLDAIAGRNLLLNATVRATKANQTGLLGFGSDDSNGYKLMFESSAALLLTHHLAVGVEFKQKPNQLAFADEQHWRDIFVAWFINRNLSVTAAYTDLGSIAGLSSQQGWYLSLEGSW